MAIGYRHNPKPRGTTAPTPFTNWAKGRIRSSDGGFQAQTQKYVYSKYNTAETRVYCGKKATTYSLNNNGTSGQIYTPDVKYGSTRRFPQHHLDGRMGQVFNGCVWRLFRLCSKARQHGLGFRQDVAFL